MEFSIVLQAFGLTLFAGLATGIGSLLALFAKRTNTRFLAVALGFSAGVMIYVSMVEIFQKAREILTREAGIGPGNWITVAAFFAGIFFIAAIDRLIPSEGGNPHEMQKVEEMAPESENKGKRKLMRMGLLTALAIGIHNFPEGLATFVATLGDTSLGLMIAVAVAIHNIPEGLAVAVPVYYATGNRKKAFVLSFLSGLAEPAGALAGYLIISSFLNQTVIGILFASIAGIMVFISLDELLSAAREYGEHHLAIYGLISGMMVMAVSLLLFI